MPGKRDGRDPVDDPASARLPGKSREFAEAARGVAKELALPLVDYHAEILKRRPTDWDGAADSFRDHQGYDVPTLLSRDGVHPSAPKKFQDDYSPEGLRSHGYNLRNYLVLMKYAEVLDALTSTPLKSNPMSRAWYPVAPPLPSPTGDVVVASHVEGLFEAARRVRPGGTICWKTASTP